MRYSEPFCTSVVKQRFISIVCHITVLLILCFGTLLICITQAQDLTQPKSGNCLLNNPCEGKGACIQEGEEYRCSCYTQYYESYNYDCIEINHCTASSPCVNGGTCRPIWGNYFCECPAQLHGRHCQIYNSTGVSRISTPLLLFNLEATELNYTTAFLIFDGEIGANLSFSMSFFNGSGLTITGHSWLIIEDVPAEMAQHTDLWRLPALRAKFATVKKKLFYFTFFYPSQTEKKRPEVLTVKVENEGVEQFAGRYSSNVTKSELWCVPEITLYDCGKTRDTTVEIQRNSKIVVRSEMESECPGSHLATSWRYYSLTSEQPFPFPFSYSKMDQGTNRVMLDKFDGKTWLEIEAHTLNYGYYIIELCVTETPIRPTTRMSHFNIAWGWIRIVPAHLVAVIANGTEITVSKDAAITLDASNSYDPNEPSNMNKGHLLFSWTCEPVEELVCKNTTFSGSVIHIKNNLLKVGAYTFSVNISIDPIWAETTGKPLYTIPGPSTFTQTIIVIDDKITHLAIRCVKNCGKENAVNIQDTVYLRAYCLHECRGADAHRFYKWTAVPQLNLNLPATELGNSLDKLIINPNVLQAGKNYKFIVDGGLRGMAVFALSTPPALPLSNGTCKLNPQTGITGITKFNLTCRGYPLIQDGFPLQYELYQTDSPDNYDEGILISYTFHPSRHNIVLMAGKPNLGHKVYLSFSVIDKNGFSHDLHGVVSAEVKSFAVNVEDHVEQLIEGPEGDLLEYLEICGKMSDIVSLISAGVSALDSATDKDIKREEEFRDSFIEAIGKIPLIDSESNLQSLSVLNLVLGHNKTARISHNGVKNAAQVLKDIVENMYTEIVERKADIHFSTIEVEHFFRKVMNCSDTIIATSEKIMEEFPNPPKEPITMEGVQNKILGMDYPDYSDVNTTYIHTRENLQFASVSIVRAITFVGMIATNHLKEGERGREIKSKNTTSYVKVDQPKEFAGHLIPANTTDGVQISTELAKAIQNKYEYVELHVALSSRNPFSWDPEGKDMNTNLLFIYMRDQRTTKRINIADFEQPLDMFISLKDPSILASSSHNMTTSNVTVPLGSIFNDEELEEHIKVHKIEGKKGSKPYLIFQSPPYKLMVVVSAGLRPSVNDFRKYSEQIPHNVSAGVPLEESLVIHVQDTRETAIHEKEFFYVAVLPEFKTMEREALYNGKDATLIVHYTFELFLLSCPMWDIETMSWDSDECEAGLRSSRKTLHCQCHHLSSFVGSVLIREYEDDPMKPVHIYLMSENSKIVLIVVLVLYALFLPLFLWAYSKDKDDIPARALTILKDNIPGQKYPYLVIAYTDLRWNAGTTSNVFIEIVGTNLKSEIHHLIDPRRKQTHKRGSDNWFAVHTSRWLGPLLHINLWHDNTGRNPSWCCEKIIIHDVRRDEAWIFLVRRWLSVIYGDGTICCTVEPASKKEVENMSSLFKEHLIMCFREDHYYLNIFLRHPRSTYTRKQRLAVCFFMILGGLMAGIWELGVPTRDDPGTQIQEEEAIISITHVLYAIKFELPIVAICFTVTLLFRKTAPKEVDAMYRHGEKYEALLAEYKALEVLEALRKKVEEEKGYVGEEVKEEKESMNAQDAAVTKREDYDVIDEIITEQTQIFSKKRSIFEEETLQENELPPEAYNTENEKEESSTVFSAAAATEVLQKKSKIARRILDVIMMEPFILSGLRIYSGHLKTSVHPHEKHFRLFQVRTDTFETSYYWFTYWFLYILWTAWLLLIAVYTYYLLYYGSLLGTVKSMEWLKSVSVSIAFGAFITQTVKAILFAAILALFYRTHAKPSQLHSGVWWDETDRLHRMILVHTKITREQYKPMFDAVSPEVILMMREKQLTRVELGRLVSDIIMFFLYIATLYCIVLASRDNLAYYSTKTLEDHVIVPDEFVDIHRQNDFIDYLNNTLIPSVHCEELYNGEPIVENGIVTNYETSLLGIVRLRQLRVKADCKPVPEINRIFDRCLLEYSTKNEDQNNYDIGWKPFNEKSFKESRVTAPWVYRTPSESGTTAVRGELKTYPGGGYFTAFGRTLNNSRAILNFLVDSSWFDRFTRVIIIDFSIYNTNQNLFNVVTMTVETPVSGAILISYSVITERLLITTSELGWEILIVIVIWIFMFILFFGTQLLRAWKESLLQYFRTPWIIIDVFIVVLGVAMMVMYIIRNYHVSQLIHHLESVDGNEFIDFTWIAAWQVQLNYIMAALVAVSTARLWRLLRFGIQFRIVEKTLVTSAKCLIFLTFMMSVLLLGFAGLAYIFAGNKIFQFSSLDLSFFYLLLYGFGFFHIRTVDIEEENSFLGRTFLLFYWILYVIYLVNMFITIIIIYYENSKIYADLKREKLDIKSYILDEIFRILGQRDDEDRESYIPYKRASLNTVDRNSTDPMMSEKRYIVQTIYMANPKPMPLYLNKTESTPVIRLKAMKALTQNFIDIDREKLQIVKPIVTNELVEGYELNTPLYIEFYHCGFENNEFQFVPDVRLKKIERLLNGVPEEAMLQMEDYLTNMKEALDEEAANLRHIEKQLDRILALLQPWKIKPYKQDMLTIIAEKDESLPQRPLETADKPAEERTALKSDKEARENAFPKINLFLNKGIKAKIFLSAPKVKKQKDIIKDAMNKGILHPASPMSIGESPASCPCSLCDMATKGTSQDIL